MLEGLTPVYSIRESTNTALWGSAPSQNDITWNQVTCNWEANGYRMPTEAEWEYAARGGNGSPGNYTYAGSNTVDDVAWHNTNRDADGTHEVGRKQPNSLGLYDMSGNVAEWCWDTFGDYTDEAQTDPLGYSENSWHHGVYRGGARIDSAEEARSVNRNREDPSRRFYRHGFRLVRRP